MKLRDYQNDSIDGLKDGFISKHKRQVLALPTGAGKTVVFSEMVRRSAQKGTVTLVLTDRTELFKQTISSLGRIGVAVEEIHPDKKFIYDKATIYLGMVETLKRRKYLNINPRLIILDEAHKGSFNSIIDRYPDALLIGATATPEGAHFYKYYTNIVQNIDIPDLVSQGFLVDVKAYQMQDDFSDLEIVRGNFTDASEMAHFDKPKLYGGVIKEWRDKANGLKTICFNVNIKHTIKMHEMFIEAGISSEYITSKTSDYDRNRILDSFKKGHFKILNNCGILTTGYDESTIQCVIMNRATLSLPLAMQIPGRGSRPWEGCINGIDTVQGRLDAIAKSPKPYFVYLDFGMNHDRHGRWNDERTWEIKPPKKKRDGIAPIKTCGNDECGCICAASAVICKFCGYAFPVKEPELNEGVMVEVIGRPPSELMGKKISDLSINELLNLEKSKAYKPTFIWRVIRSMGEDSIKEYAKLKEYKSGWVKRQIEDINNCEFTNYKIK